MGSVRLVVNLKNSFPFLFTPLTTLPQLAKSLSVCVRACPSTNDDTGVGPGLVLKTETRSSFFMPIVWITPSPSPSASFCWRLPLVRGKTVMVPRSAWEVCVMSVREKERLMAATKNSHPADPPARAPSSCTTKKPAGV